MRHEAFKSGCVRFAQALETGLESAEKPPDKGVGVGLSVVVVGEPAAARVTLDHAEAAMALRALRYGDDEHYDVLSAFIKSIRGSDPDAGLYWLARMLEAGEDARYIASYVQTNMIRFFADPAMADGTRYRTVTPLKPEPFRWRQPACNSPGTSAIPAQMVSTARPARS